MRSIFLSLLFLSLSYFHANGQIKSDGLLIVAAADFSIRIIDEKTHAILKVFNGHTGKISQMAIDTAHHQLASQSADKTIRIWDLLTGKTIKIISIFNDTGSPVTFSGNGNYFTYTSLLRLSMLDTHSWNEVRAFQVDMPTSVLFLNNDTWLAIADAFKKEIRIFDIHQATGIQKRLADTAWQYYPTILMTQDPISNLLITSTDTIIRIYSLPNLELVNSFTTPYKVEFLQALANETGFVAGSVNRPIIVSYKPNKSFARGVLSSTLIKDFQGGEIFAAGSSSLRDQIYICGDYSYISFFDHKESLAERKSSVVDTELIRIDTTAYSSMIFYAQKNLKENNSDKSLEDNPGQPSTAGKPGIVLQSGHTSSVEAILMSKDKQYIFSLDMEGMIKIWDNNSQLLVKTIVTGLNVSDHVKIFLKDSILIVAAEDIGAGVKMQWWDWKQSTLIKVRFIKGDGSNWQSPDEFVCIHTSDSFEEQKTILFNLAVDSTTVEYPYIFLATVSRAAGTLVGVNILNNQIEIFDPSTGRKEDSIPTELTGRKNIYFEKVILSRDGKWFGLSTTFGNHFEMYNLTDHRKIFSDSVSHIFNFTFDPEISLLVTSQGVMLPDGSGMYLVTRNLKNGVVIDTLNRYVQNKEISYLRLDENQKLNMGFNEGTVATQQGAGYYDLNLFNPSDHFYLTGLTFNKQRSLLDIDLAGKLRRLDISKVSYEPVIVESYPDGLYKPDAQGLILVHTSYWGDSLIVKNLADSSIITSFPIKDTLMKILYVDAGKKTIVYQTSGDNLVISKNWSHVWTKIKLPHLVFLQDLKINKDQSVVAFVVFSATSIQLYNIAGPSPVKLDTIPVNSFGPKLLFSEAGNELIFMADQGISFYPLAVDGNPGHGMTIPTDNPTDMMIDPFNPNHLITVSYDANVRIWDIKNKTLEHVFPMPLRLMSICATGEKNIFMVGAGNGTIYRASITENRIMNTIYLTDNSCLITDTAGNYLTTSYLFRDYGFSVDNKVYDLNQFDATFNRPDKVLETFSFVPRTTVSLYNQIYKKRISTLQNQLEIDKLPRSRPFIEIERVEIDTVNDNAIVFTRSRDSLSQLVRISITCNEVPWYDEGPRAEMRSDRVDTLKIPLIAGKNDILISVVNIDSIYSLNHTVTVTYQKELKSDFYFVGLGCSKYETYDSLAYVDADIRSLSATLRSHEGSWFNKLILDTFCNERVRTENLSKIRETLKKTKPADIVFLIYSGHGMIDTVTNTFYMAGYNMNFSAPAKNGISLYSLEHLMDSIPARSKIVLINACQSGDFDKDMNVYLRMKAIFSDLRSSNGSTVIASAGWKQSALVSDKRQLSNLVYAIQMLYQNSPCRNGLIADQNQDGQISVDELKNFLSEAVPELSHGEQNPIVRKQNPEMNFRFW
jgi:WD40 repeat protein